MKRRAFALLLVLPLAAAAAAHADEIRLKDGSKINGTIVGYEDGTFKVETSYGFALIRKERVAEIVPSAEPAKPGAPGAGAPNTPPPSSAAAEPAAPKPAAESASAPPKSAVHPAPASKPPVAASAPQPLPLTPIGGASPAAARGAKPASSTAVATPAPPSITLSAAKPAAATPAPATHADDAAAPTSSSPVAAPATTSAPASATALVAAPAPPAPEEPRPVMESVRGNLYINATYGFRMYRPPDWQVIPDPRKDVPNAVAALGTLDENTLFIVGRDPAHDSLDAHAAATERTLQRIYDHYRLVSSTHATVAGSPAIEKHFRGEADGHDWSGTSLTFARGGDVFTILAMTYADSDLIQIQENVIAKTIASLSFDAAH